MTCRYTCSVNLSVLFVQNVIDGDLCEMYSAMDSAKQKSVAEELDRTPAEVSESFSICRLSLNLSIRIMPKHDNVVSITDKVM